MEFKKINNFMCLAVLVQCYMSIEGKMVFTKPSCCVVRQKNSLRISHCLKLRNHTFINISSQICAMSSRELKVNWGHWIYWIQCLLKKKLSPLFHCWECMPMRFCRTDDGLNSLLSLFYENLCTVLSREIVVCWSVFKLSLLVEEG